MDTNPKLKKKSKKLAIFIFFILLVVAYSLFFTSIGCSPKQSSKAEQTEDVYYCPMHPSYTSDRPGDCPICNMKLVKKQQEFKTMPSSVHQHEGMQEMTPQAEEKSLEQVCIEHNCTMKDCPMKIRAELKPGERIYCPICGEVISTTSSKVVEIVKPQQATGPTVMISSEKQQLIGVKTAPVMRRDLKKIIRASGKIAYDPELAIAQEEFIQALTNEENVKESPLKDVLDRAEALTEAARNKLKLLGMSEEQITQLEKIKKADTSLYLPEEGENVWAYVSIYEYEIGLVKTAAPVEIETVAYPGETFQGKVVSISPVLDPLTRTNQVRVEVANPENKLKPEMFVNAKIYVELGEKLALPDSAIMDTGLRKIVYLSREGGVLEAREVSLGQHAEGYYEVLKGVDEGDIVVTSGNFFIDSESKLKSALEGAGHQH